MSTRSSLLNLGRVGAVTAAAVALVGLAACIKVEAPANNTAAATNTASAQTGATNGAGLGASTVPGAPVAPANGMASGGDMSAQASGTGGMMAPGGSSGGMMGPGGEAPGGAGGVGGSTAMSAPQGGDQSGGPQAGGGGDQNANDDYDKNFINACFHTAVKNGNSVDSAANYCTCAMAELDELSLAQKQSLSGNSPQVMRAERDCQANAD